jgi:GST-like protein
LTLQLHAFDTPNGRKITVALEEMGLPYELRIVDIGQGEQFDPAFLEISPNNKIPAIVDPDGPGGKSISVFESGAILIYLAEKTGQFWPSDAVARVAALEWLMFQVGGFGPMPGQVHHFIGLQDPADKRYGLDRFMAETRRLYGVMNTQLASHRYIAGASYSVADIAIFPWLRNWANQGIEWEDYPHVKAWFDKIAKRPAVVRGVSVLAHLRKPLQDDKAREVLFGKTQYQAR